MATTGSRRLYFSMSSPVLRGGDDHRIGFWLRCAMLELTENTQGENSGFRRFLSRFVSRVSGAHRAYNAFCEKLDFLCVL